MLGRCSVGRCSVGAHHAAHGELGHLPALPLGGLVGDVLALLQRPQVMHLVRVSNAAAPTGNALARVRARVGARVRARGRARARG